MAASFGPALLGGACLGVTSVAVLAQTGGILGISGIVGGLLAKGRRSQPWRWAFVGGLLAGARIALRLHPASFTAPESTFSLARAVIGGLLVGSGATLGGGCTSGHGVCGVSRLSPRSLVFIFVAILLGHRPDLLVLCSSSLAMTAGGVAATASGAAAAIPAAGSASGPPAALLHLMLGGAAALLAAPVVFRAAAGGKRMSDASEARLRTVVYGAAGFVFALGLSVSGMLDAGNVVAFLSPGSAAFDPRLAAVVAGAVGSAVLPFQTIGSWGGLRRAGLVSQEHPGAPGGRVDRRLLLGAVLFGTGWGVSGMCPGPAVTNLVRPSPQVPAAVASMLAGMALVQSMG